MRSYIVYYQYYKPVWSVLLSVTLGPTPILPEGLENMKYGVRSTEH